MKTIRCLVHSAKQRGEVGARLRFTNGTVQEVQPNGSLRNIGERKLSKRERKWMRGRVQP